MEARRGSSRLFLCLLAFATLVRLAYFVHARPWDDRVAATAIVVGDATEYNGVAQNILRDFNFASTFEWRCPGYPTFLAAIYYLFGTKPWLVVLLQLFLNIASVALVYGIGEALTGPGVGLLGAFLYSIDYFTLDNIVTHLPDTLMVFMLLAAVWTLLLAMRRDRAMLYMVSGLILGLAILVKPILQYFPAAAVLFLLVFSCAGWKRRLSMAAVFLLFLALPVAPWLGRNFIRYDHAALSAQPWYSMLYYNVALTEVSRTGRSYEEIKAQFQDQARRAGAEQVENPFDQAAIYQKISLRYIRQYPLLFARENGKGMVRMFASTNLGKVGLVPLALAAILGVLYLFAFAGAWRLTLEKNFIALSLLTGALLYFTLLTGVIGGARYRLPLVPFYSLLSAVGLIGIASSLRRRAAPEKARA
jgi:4-amino-4-deoxy-L-arabinose transferase-like glycosyltransferase